MGSAAAFDFFLTPPYLNFAITQRDDIEAAVLLALIGLAVTEIALWGRRQQARASTEDRGRYLLASTSAVRRPDLGRRQVAVALAEQAAAALAHGAADVLGGLGRAGGRRDEQPLAPAHHRAEVDVGAASREHTGSGDVPGDPSPRE